MGLANRALGCPDCMERGMYAEVMSVLDIKIFGNTSLKFRS